jgi:hypothetical protein
MFSFSGESLRVERANAGTSLFIALHDYTFSFLGPRVALLVRGVDQWICFLVFLDIFPHPVNNTEKNTLH